MRNIKAADLTVGQEIALINFHSFGITSEIRETTIEKITATRVVLANGQRWIVDKWGEVNRLEKTESYRSPHFLPVGHETVIRAKANNEIQKSSNGVRSVVAELMSHQSVMQNVDKIDEVVAVLLAHKELVLNSKVED